MDKQSWFGLLPLCFVAVIIAARAVSFLIGGRRTHAGLRLMSLGIALTIGAALLGAFANAKLSEAYLQFVHNAVVSRSAGGR